MRDPLTHTDHAHLTNIQPERPRPEDLAQIYAARWASQLFFRELKRHYRDADMPSANRIVVDALVTVDAQELRRPRWRQAEAAYRR